MSDRISRALSEYASTKSVKLSQEVVKETKRHLLDTMAIALGALQEEGPKAARRYACRFPLPEGSSIWGSSFRTIPEAATLANGVAIRYFDYNDNYLGLEGLHPSDMIAGLISMGEWIKASGRMLMEAIAIAYEVGIDLCDTFSVREYGWDHVNITAIGACCGIGRMMGLTSDQLDHALAITVIPHAAMRQTRVGELSMWKGFAAADAVRQSAYACMLAAAGTTGPFQPFEGEMGYFRLLLNNTAVNERALKPILEGHPPRRILDTHIKAWPVEYHAQSAVAAAFSLRQELEDPELIQSVKINTFKAAYEIIAKDPEKWQPKTRETADHSLPYIVAAALMDGRINLETFKMDRVMDPILRQFLKERITLEECAELTSAYPDGIPNRIEVRTTDGRTLVKEVKYPPGHVKNPMSDEALHEKYLSLAGPVLGRQKAEVLSERIQKLESMGTISELTDLVVL